MLRPAPCTLFGTACVACGVRTAGQGEVTPSNTIVILVNFTRKKIESGTSAAILLEEIPAGDAAAVQDRPIHFPRFGRGAATGRDTEERERDGSARPPLW